MLTMLRGLLAHAAWADAEFYRAWGASPARDHEELRTRAGHVVLVTRNYLTMTHGQTATWSADGPLPTFAALHTAARAGHDAWRDFAAALTPADLDQPVPLPWFRDPPFTATAAEVLTQVALHAQHHRGQLMTRLHDFGGTPVNVDWIIWLWRQKPAAVWE